QTSSKSQEQSKQITNLQENFNKLAKAVAGLKQSIAKEQQTLKRPPGPGKQKADNLAMDHFLDSLAEDTGLPEDFYDDDDPVEDLRKQFDDLTLNVAKLAKSSAVLSGIELLLGIGSDMQINLDQDLELFFFISVLRGVDSGYKVSLPICLKFLDEVDKTSVDIGNISVEMQAQ
ncbi:33166_t:CDS:2, partial [Gigaspora margarita]